MRNLVFLVIIHFLVACSAERGQVNGEPLDHIGDATPVLSESVMPLKILIFGGSSGVGLQTTKLALARGHTVTSVTRHPDRMPIEHARLNNQKGDITQRDSFDHLIQAQDAIISTIGLKPTRKEIWVYSKGITNVLAAMNDHGVDRVLTITGIGAGNSKGHGGFFYDKILNPLMLKTGYDDKTRQEEILVSSDTQWTIVRPGFFDDKAPKQQYRVIMELQGFTSGSIARADVAHFLLSAVEQNNYLRHTVFLSN
jgi:putative NADH-flavin reductase